VDEDLARILGFRRLSPLLATSGQPGAEELVVIARAGFRHLINLATAQSPGALSNEAELAAKAGLAYEHLPIDWEAPELERAARLFARLDELCDEPVFVHCAKNMRVSALLSAYRIVRRGVSCAEARADLHAIWQPNHTWRRYVSNVALAALRRPVRFESERLVLRDAELSDAEAIHSYAGDASVCQYLIWGPNTLEQTRAHLQFRVNVQQVEAKRRDFELLLVEKASGAVIGGAGLRVADSSALDADLGYVLARAHWGRGLVPEACAKLLEVAFGWLGLHRVWASTDALNVPSQRVLEKLGMRREAHLIENAHVKGRYRDTVVYALTDTEYWASGASRAGGVALPP
jgi:[ribosomal protein S5]-alanine N-acetyltransferase